MMNRKWRIYYYLWFIYNLCLWFLRTTIRNLVVFYACFLKCPTVTYVSIICYAIFFIKELFGLLFFRRSPLFTAFARKWGGEKKGGGEKQFAGSAKADLRCLVAAKGEARGRAGALRAIRGESLITPCNGHFLRISLLSGFIFCIIPNKITMNYTYGINWQSTNNELWIEIGGCIAICDLFINIAYKFFVNLNALRV